jgi:hypothetical protein
MPVPDGQLLTVLWKKNYYITTYPESVRGVVFEIKFDESGMIVSRQPCGYNPDSEGDDMIELPDELKALVESKYVI